MIIPYISTNISIYKRSPNHESCYLRIQSTALWNHLLHSQGFTGKHFYQSVKDSLAFMKLVHHKEVESWAKLSLIFSWIFLQPFIPILQSFIFPDGSFMWGIKSHCFSCCSFSLYPWACASWWREAPSAENLHSWFKFLSWVVFLLDSMPLFCKNWLFILFSYY